MSDYTNIISKSLNSITYTRSPFYRKRLWLQLQQVLNAAIRETEFVPFNQFGNNMIESLTPGVDPMAVKNDNKPILAEAIITYQICRFGVEFYGSPIFEYDLSGSTERYEDVDFWRNAIKFGRETGANTRLRRLQNLLKYKEPERGVWTTRPSLSRDAWRNLTATYVRKINSKDSLTRESEFSFSSSTTNAGEWTYMRKSGMLDGVKVRDIVKRDARSLSSSPAQFMQLPAFLGARAQRGKWALVGITGTIEEHISNMFKSKHDFVSQDYFVRWFLKYVRYSNTKARVVTAAPSSWSYAYAPLGFSKIEVEKTRTAPAQIHLFGPTKIRDAMLITKSKVIPEIERTLGCRVLGYNSDATSYDTTLTGEHADDVYSYIAPMINNGKDKLYYKMGLVSALSRPLLYNANVLPISFSNAKKCNVLLRTHALGSGEPVTNDFGSNNMELQTEKSRIATCPIPWNKIRNIFVRHGVSPIWANGDDNWTVFVLQGKPKAKSTRQHSPTVVDSQSSLSHDRHAAGSHVAVANEGAPRKPSPNQVDSNGSGKTFDTQEIQSITLDLTNHTADMQDHNGLLFQDPLNKGEAGFFYNQFRLTYDDRFISPLTRIRLYHRESADQQRGPYISIVDKLMNYEFRYDCKGIKHWIANFELPYDKTLMGTRDMVSGKQLTFAQFRKLVSNEARDSSKSIKEILYRGNPYDARVIRGDQLDEDWLLIQWSKMKTIVDEVWNRTTNKVKSSYRFI